MKIHIKNPNFFSPPVNVDMCLQVPEKKFKLWGTGNLVLINRHSWGKARWMAIGIT